MTQINVDGIHARDVAEYVSATATATALDMRLAPRQVGKGFEDAKACL